MTVTPDMPPDDSHNRRESAYSESHKKRIDDDFEKAISEQWDVPPSVHDQIDPRVVTVLSVAQNYSQRLNQVDKTERKELRLLEKYEQKLAKQWRKLGLEGSGVSITGKIRPVIEPDKLDIFGEMLDDDDKEDLLYLLPEQQRDMFGSYYLVENFPLTAGKLVIGEVGIEVDDEMIGKYYRGTLFLAWGDNSSPDEPLFTVAPDELEYIGIPIGEGIGAEFFLREHFPALLEAINANIPDDCRDDKEIFDALSHFTFEISKRQIGKHMPEDDFWDLLAEYLNVRVNFQKVQYNLTIEGKISSRSAAHEAIPYMQTPPRTYSVKIGRPYLYPQDDTDDADTARCEIVLETFTPGTSWNGGWIPLFVPMSSIVGYESTRNVELPFRGAVAFHDRQLDDDLPVIPADGEHFKPRTRLDSEDDAATAINQVGTILPLDSVQETAEHIGKLADISNRMTYLRVMQDELDDMIESFAGLTKIAFVHSGVCKDVMARIKQRFDRFQANYADRPFAINAAGEAVYVASAQPRIDPSLDESGVIMHVPFADFVQGNATTETRGYLSEELGITMMYDSSIKGNRIEIEFRLIDIDRNDFADVTDSKRGLSVFELKQSSFHQVQVTSSTRLTIDELDFYNKQKEAEEALVKLINEDSKLSRRLQRFIKAMGKADKSETYSEIGSAKVLRAVARYAKANPAKSSEICAHIAALIGSNRQIVISGQMIIEQDYHSDPDTTQSGRFITVVDDYRYRFSGIAEPMAAIQLTDDPNYGAHSIAFVPLATMTGFQA